MAGELTRRQARELIVETAGKARQLRARGVKRQVWRPFARPLEVPLFAPKALTMRHLNEAVCICRRLGLLKPDVYVTAGFNPPRPRARHPRQAA